MEKLPNEILLTIFKYLDSSAILNLKLVNRKWNDLTNEHLTSKIHLFAIRHSRHLENFLELFHQKQCHVNSIRFQLLQIRQLPPEHVLSNLERLELTDVDLTPIVRTLVSKCQNLKSLIFNDIKVKSKCLSEFENLMQVLPQTLQRLSMDTFSFQTQMTPMIAKSAIIPAPNQFLNILKISHGHLKTLHLKNLPIVFREEFITKLCQIPGLNLKALGITSNKQPTLIQSNLYQLCYETPQVSKRISNWMSNRTSIWTSNWISK